MAILYISMIASLGAMGVGYAVWNDGLNIDMDITTTNATTLYDLKKGYDVLSLVDGELVFNLSKDKQLLEITGEVYPGFVENIELRMKDEEGSIPTKLKEIKVLSEAEIADVKEEKQVSYRGIMGRKSRFRAKSYGDEDSNKIFQLNINSNKADSGSSNNRFMRTMSSSTLDAEGGDIERLRNDINKLKREIDAYDQVKEYEFKYHFVFEQSI